MVRNRRPTTEYRGSAADLVRQADRFRARQLEVTAPVYQTVESGIPDLVGSAVLPQFANSRFLVTAGHVLDRRIKAPLIIGVSPTFLALSGDVTRLWPPDSAPSGHDYIDIGIVKLEGAAWEGLPDHSFASWEELDIPTPITERHTFGLIGFPVNKNRDPLRGDQMKAQAYGVAGLECERDAYDRTSTSPDTNLMLGFVKKDVWAADGKRTAPDLNGVSGCAVWRYGRYIREADRAPLIAGIAIEWHKHRQPQYILATRIHLAIAALAEKYAAVGNFVLRKLAADNGAA